MPDSVETRLQVVVSQLRWVLGIELWSSARAEHVLNWRAFPPVP